jgi:hypothetical protein
MHIHSIGDIWVYHTTINCLIENIFCLIENIFCIEMGIAYLYWYSLSSVLRNVHLDAVFDFVTRDVIESCHANGFRYIFEQCLRYLYHAQAHC